MSADPNTEQPANDDDTAPTCGLGNLSAAYRQLKSAQLREYYRAEKAERQLNELRANLLAWGRHRSAIAQAYLRRIALEHELSMKGAAPTVGDPAQEPPP